MQYAKFSIYVCLGSLEEEFYLLLPYWDRRQTLENKTLLFKVLGLLQKFTFICIHILEAGNKGCPPGVSTGPSLV